MPAPGDAIVVGAGVAGTATAWSLARQGVSVTLVERGEVCCGASGRNPGFVWLQTKTQGVQMDLALAGRQYMEALDEAIGAFEFRDCGGLIVIRDERLLDAGEAFAADRRSAGLPVSLLNGGQVRELVPGVSESVVAGVWNPLDAHQNTTRLVRNLADAAEHEGATIRCGAAVEALAEHSGRIEGIRLDDGTRLSADVVVLANAHDANRLLAPFDLPVPMIPVRYEALETAPSDTRVSPVVCGQSLFGHFDFIEDLLVEAGPVERAGDPHFPELGFTEQIAQYADGRFQLGCAVTYDTTDDRPTLAGLGLAGTIIARNMPALARMPVERTWAGIVAQTPDYLPVLSSRYGPEGLALNVAHSFGNVAGALSGDVLADMILRREPRFDPGPLAPERFASSL